MGFRSLQRSPAQRSRWTRRFPSAGTLRPQGSSPLDALLPFAPPDRFRSGRSWDSYLQGFVPPGDPALFRADPSPPDVARPHRRTLAVTSMGPGDWTRWIRPRVRRVSRLQGFSLRESVPLQRLFRALQRPMPSWFSSSLRSSPPWSSEEPSPLDPLACFVLDRLPRGSRPWLHHSVLPDPAVAWSLSRLPASPRSFPWVDPPLRTTPRRWVMDSPRGREGRHRSCCSSIRAAESFCRSSMGRPLGPR